MLKCISVTLPHGLSSACAGPWTGNGVALLTGKCWQDSGEQRSAAPSSLDPPAKASIVFLPFSQGETASGPNPGRLPGGKLFIVINLLLLVTSFKSVRNLLRALIRSLILKQPMKGRWEWTLAAEVPPSAYHAPLSCTLPPSSGPPKGRPCPCSPCPLGSPLGAGVYPPHNHRMRKGSWRPH